MNAATSCRPANRLQLKSGVLLASMAVLITLAGCSKSEPTLGDTIRAQGIGLAEIGEQWSEGNDMLDEGRDQIEQGQDMINEGESLLETGKDNVKRGQQAKQQAEVSYREKTGRDLPIIQ